MHCGVVLHKRIAGVTPGVDHIDDINFQDDRLWIQYGGQYSATGVHPDCPERYRGRVYVNNEQWDVRALGDCSSGSVQRVVASSSFFQDDPTNR